MADLGILCVFGFMMGDRVHNFTLLLGNGEWVMVSPALREGFPPQATGSPVGGMGHGEWVMGHGGRGAGGEIFLLFYRCPMPNDGRCFKSAFALGVAEG
ncbi:hypothetical protein [Tolypothrix sp. VBCCA 56010]|uniref:hypothetical protein n=1 Tax=Tolypothrix sp. VBCCA 56010 TaxID=3137731 RepID=UPI003D7EAF3E